MKKSKKVTLAQKAKKAGIPAQIVYNRMHEGWSEKKALSVPVNKYTKKKPEKVAYKVEPKKEQASGSRVKIADSTVKIPLPVQKFEAPKDKTLLYVVVACVVILVLAVIANT